MCMSDPLPLGLNSIVVLKVCIVLQRYVGPTQYHWTTEGIAKQPPRSLPEHRNEQVDEHVDIG